MKIKSIKMTPVEINTLKNRYKHLPMRYDIQHTQFQVKGSDFTITAYNSGKVVFQGDDITFLLPKEHQSTDTVKPVKKKTPQSTNIETINIAGSDEVGTGDYFGPVTVCAAYVSEEDLEHLPVSQIQDTKSMSDEVIIQIAPIIMDQIQYSLLVLDNEKYNEVQKKHNMNAIKAIMHNKAFLNLEKKVPLPDKNVIDQFAHAKLYYSYLVEEPEIFTKLHFETEAEDKFISVACAAIIARYAFLKAFEKMDQTYDFKFPMGSTSNVDIAAKEFVKLHGAEALNKVAKLHFKITQRVLKEH